MKNNTDQESPAWVADAVFYQIFPDRFCNSNKTNDPARLNAWGETPTRENFFGGDLKGIQIGLDYLQELGVNALYLNPIFRAGTNHRYDTIDYFQIDPGLGDMQQLKDLVAEIHRRNMHIILDGVFNHSGDQFPAFRDVVNNGVSSDFASWFNVLSYPIHTEPINYMSCGGCIYLPKFNHAHQPVRDFIFSVVKYWMKEVDLDGWRLDVPYKIAPEFWQEFRRIVKTINPQAYLVGEVWRDARPWIQGDTFDGTTNYRLRELIIDYVLTQVLDGEDFGYEIQTLITELGPAAYSMLNLLGSHDTPRLLTILNNDTELMNIALTIQMTLPGAPILYYGDEIGLTGGPDPDCRCCMPWEKKLWNTEILAQIQSLIRFRKAHPALRHGKIRILTAVNGVCAYKLEADDDEVLVVLNPREAFFELPISTFSSYSTWIERSDKGIYFSDNGILYLRSIPARSALVYAKEKLSRSA